MVETISPVVHGGRNRSYWTAIALHTFGATLSAALLGAALGGLGWLLGAPWGDWGYLLIAAVAFLYFAREAFNLPIPLPQLRRQVPDWWRTYFSPPVAALLYGFGLGVAFLTYVSFGTLAVVSVAVIATANPLVGALCFAVFGLARSLPLVALSTGQTSMERLEDLSSRRLPHNVNGAAIVILGAAAVLALL